MVQARGRRVGVRRSGTFRSLIRGSSMWGISEHEGEELLPMPESPWSALPGSEFGKRRAREIVLVDPGQEEKLIVLLDVSKDLQRTVSSLEKKVQRLETLLEQTHTIALGISQTYYWTPEWQDKERRADEDARSGRSKRYSSAEELIREINK